MALSPIKTFVEEVLTPADLNTLNTNILNNALSLISPLTGSLDVDGNTLVLDAAAVTTVSSTASGSWVFTSGAKSGTPATTGSVANWAAQTFTDSATAGSGTATNYVSYAIQRPTLAATNASVVTTNAATFYIPNSPAAGTNQTITNAYALWTDDGRVRLDPSATVVSATSATLDAVNITAQTATISGSTAITTATGVNFVSIGTPTYSAASALTVTNAATLYIAAAPVGAGAGPATISNAYSIWVDAGNVRFDADVSAATLTGAVIATQTQQEAGTASNVVVTPSTQQFHPSAPKVWVQYDSGGALTSSYNVTSVTDNAAGNLSPVWATDFSAGAYCLLASGVAASAPSNATTWTVQTVSILAGGANIVSIRLSDFTQVDVSYIMAIGMGDQ